jgi:hypothetical protein
MNTQESPESLLRSALQGKGYAKTVHLQSSSGITLIPSQNTVKQEDEELRRVLFTNDQVRDSMKIIYLLFFKLMSDIIYSFSFMLIYVFSPSNAVFLS